MGKIPETAQFYVAAALSALLLFGCWVILLSRPSLADFGSLYTGSFILHEGNVSKLYSVNEQQRVQEQFLNRKGLVIDAYPPVLALLLEPLVQFGYRAAYVTFGVFNILLWCCFTILLKPQAASIQPFRYLMLCSMFPPLWLALLQGQVSVLLLVFFTVAFLWLKRGADFWAGFALGLGLLKFQLVLPLAFIFLLRRKWKFIAGFAGAAVLLGLLSLMVAGPSGIVAYVRLFVDIARHPDDPAFVTLTTSDMPTIRAFVTALLTGRIAQHYVAAIWATLSAVLILFTAWCWRSEQPDFNLMFAGAVVVSLITAPHMYLQDLTEMLLSILLVVASREFAQNSKSRSVVILMTAIIYAAPFYYLELRQHELTYLVTPVLVVFALATLRLGGKHAVELPPHMKFQT